jgi:hypothetical protein
MDRLVLNTGYKQQYSIYFGKCFKATLEGIKTKNCELSIFNSSDRAEPDDFNTLNKYLDNLSLSKIVFNAIKFYSMNSRDDLKIYELMSGFLLSKIIKIPIVRFENCDIPMYFSKTLFSKESKIIDISFKGCHLNRSKPHIIYFTKSNYTIRNLIIEDVSKLNDIALDGEIKSHLYRNRAQYMSRMAAISLIVMGKHKNNLLSRLDRFLLIYLAKMIYPSKGTGEWLKVVWEEELSGFLNKNEK